MRSRRDAKDDRRGVVCEVEGADGGGEGAVREDDGGGPRAV